MSLLDNLKISHNALVMTHLNEKQTSGATIFFLISEQSYKYVKIFTRCMKCWWLFSRTLMLHFLVFLLSRWWKSYIVPIILYVRKYYARPGIDNQISGEKWEGRGLWGRKCMERCFFQSVSVLWLMIDKKISPYLNFYLACNRFHFSAEKL